MNNRTCYKNTKDILELIFLQEGKIRLRLYKSRREGTVRFYQENKIDMDRLNDSIKEIRHYLKMVNIIKNPDIDFYTRLQKSCQVLYYELLNTEIKLSLEGISYKSLELVIDDQLLDIPWELLFDGEKFLCERFGTGRNIMTKGEYIYKDREESDERSTQLKVLVIADPTGDLKVAFEEGFQIFDEFRKRKDLVNVTFHSSDMVNLDFLKKNLIDFDIVHFAGHVEYDCKEPDRSGWVLSDGKFTTADILKMVNKKLMMPALVFCNACRSGFVGSQSEKPGLVDAACPDEGLVHAFIRAGVRYYIGTFSEVSDEYGAYMGLEFYNHLMQGNTIGESLRKARRSFREKFGAESYSWINYMLYGDPAGLLIEPQKEPVLEEKNKKEGLKRGYRSKKEPLHDKSSIYSNLNPIPPVTRQIRLLSRWNNRDKRIVRLIFLLVFLSIMILFVFYIQKGRESRSKRIDFVKTKEKRIEDLKKAIYEKLKTREDMKRTDTRGIMPEISNRGTDNWTSRVITVAIFDLCNKPKHLPDWSIVKIEELYRNLTRLFVSDKRIRVVEREALDRLLGEKDLVLSDLPLNSIDYRKLLGGFLYARVMVFLEGYRSSDGGIYLCYKLVDVEKGEIFKAGIDTELNKKGSSSNLANMIYKEMKRDIDVDYPLRGRIETIKGQYAVINIGYDAGVREGDIFLVLESNLQREKTGGIGKIRVVRDPIDSGRALCEILEGEGLKKGLRIEALVP